MCTYCTRDSIIHETWRDQQGPKYLASTNISTAVRQRRQTGRIFQYIYDGLLFTFGDAILGDRAAERP